jgi:hypothetical protein
LREGGGVHWGSANLGKAEGFMLPQRRHGMTIPPERSEEKQKLVKEYAYGGTRNTSLLTPPPDVGGASRSLRSETSGSGSMELSECSSGNIVEPSNFSW